MRAYIRHPADVPIQFSSVTDDQLEEAMADNISLGGLSFGCKKHMQVGTFVNVKIDIVDPVFEAKAKVVWCLSRPDKYEAGIEFVDEQDAFTARMVEQVCHIEHYRLWVKEVEGRDIDGELAAREWIEKFAKDFPKITDE